MELAIPLLTLGAAFVIANHEKVNVNQNHMKHTKTWVMQQTQPFREIIPTTSQRVDATNAYPTSNAATARYLNQNAYEERERDGLTLGNSPQQIYSLTGEKLT